MHEMVSHSHSAESFAGRWCVGRRRQKTHMLMRHDKEEALACECEAAALPTFPQKCSKHCTQQALGEKTGVEAVRGRGCTQSGTQTHTHTYRSTYFSRD